MKRNVIVLVFLLNLLVSCSSGGKISPSEAWSKIERGAVLVDVRTPSEYNSGHIEGAKNIPLDEIKRNPKGVGLETGKELVLYCRSGHRAGLAEAVLEQHGFKRVYNAGGYSDIRSGKPTS